MSRKERFLGHIKRNRDLYLAFLIPFAIMASVCIARGIYPFGNQCFLHIDMYHQYCPFMAEFLDRLQEGGSLMYAWELGLGSDFMGLYAYYLASPMNWLVFLVPEGACDRIYDAADFDQGLFVRILFCLLSEKPFSDEKPWQGIVCGILCPVRVYLRV